MRQCREREPGSSDPAPLDKDTRAGEGASGGAGASAQWAGGWGPGLEGNSCGGCGTRGWGPVYLEAPCLGQTLGAGEGCGGAAGHPQIIPTALGFMAQPVLHFLSPETRTCGTEPQGPGPHAAPADGSADRIGTSGTPGGGARTPVAADGNLRSRHQRQRGKRASGFRGAIRSTVSRREFVGDEARPPRALPTATPPSAALQPLRAQHTSTQSPRG